jgi:hypothetical protein
VGTVPGVAALVAVLARVDPLNALSGYRHGVILIVAFFAAAAILAASMLTTRSPGAPATPTPLVP